MHKNAHNTWKVFDHLDYYQKCIKNSSKIKKIFLETKKCSSFSEFGGHSRRSLLSKLQNFMPLRPNHGGPLRVTAFITNFKQLPPSNFQNSTTALKVNTILFIISRMSNEVRGKCPQKLSFEILSIGPL